MAYDSTGLQALLKRLNGAVAQTDGNFDSQYDSGIRGLMGQTMQEAADLPMEDTRAQEGYNQNSETLGRQNKTALTNNAVNMADRGLAFSGINLGQQGAIAENTQRGMQGLSDSLAQKRQDITRRGQKFEGDVTNRLADFQGQRAAKAAEREQQKAWQDTQTRLADEQSQRSMDMQRQQMEQSQRQADALQQQIAAAQPVASDTGSYASSGGGGGGGGGGSSYSGGGGRVSAPASYDTNTNVSVDFREYNLRDPYEVKELQTYLGLKPDGKYGAATDNALKQKNAVMFNDRPIDKMTRLSMGRRAAN